MALDRTEHDIKNRKILDYVRHKPNATVVEIAKTIEMKRAATQKRITKLVRAHRLKRALIVDLDALGFRYRYRVDIKIAPQTLKAQFKVLEDKIPNPQMRLAHHLMNALEINDSERAASIIIEDVSIVLGEPADLTAIVRTNDPSHILGFVTTDLRGIPGVENTSTSFEAWTYSR